jgi:hypothetical protein
MRAIAGFAGLALLLLATEAGAQQEKKTLSSTEQSSTPPATPSLVERMTPAPVPPNLQPRWSDETRTTSEEQPLQPAPPPRGNSVALMIAGGALFLAGILTDGDAGAVLMVGGAVVGAYGLYLYFR